MKEIFRFLTVSSIVLLLTSLNTELKAQAKIQGTVVSDTEEALIGANILIPELNLGTAADLEGKFTFENISYGTYTLKISSIGYEDYSAEISVTEPLVEVFITMDAREYETSEITVSAVKVNPNERIIDGISKLPVSQRYQTQSVTVIDEDILREQQINNLEDAVQIATGFNVESNRGNTNPSIQVRGESATLLVNGLRLESNTRGGDGLIDFNTIENLQFINGSSSIGLGNASTGGSVNIATKQVTFNNSGYAFSSAGSFGQASVGFDKQVLINKDLGIRLNGSFDRGATYREGTDFRSYTISPSIGYRLSGKDQIKVDYIFDYDNRTPDVGQLRADSALLALNGTEANGIFEPLPGMSITDSFAGFDQDFQAQRSHALFVTYDRRLNPSLNLSLKGGYYDKDRDKRSIITRRAYADTDGDRINDAFIRRSSYQEFDARSYNIRADLTGAKVQTGAFTHNFQVSADVWGNENGVLGNGSQSRDPGPEIDRIDLLNPVFRNDISEFTQAERDAYYSRLLNTENRRNRRIWGLTIQEQISFRDRLRLTLGMRYSFGTSWTTLVENADTDNPVSTRSDDLNFDGFSPNLGLFYDLTRNVTVFGTYSNTFDETSISPTRVDINGELLGNEVVDQLETGVRSSFFNGKLGVNLTYYRIFNDNLAVRATDETNEPLTSPSAVSPVNPEGEYFVRVSEETRQGLELGVIGQVIPGLRVFGNYAYYRFSTRQDQDSPEVFAVTDYNPRHSGSFQATYTFNRGLLNGFSVGAGMQHVGDRSVTARGRNGFTYVSPSFTTFSFNAAYTFGDFELSAKMNNITDELAYNNFGTTYLTPINPFNFTTRLTYNF